MTKVRLFRCILVVLLVLWLVLIFVMSSEPAVQSTQTSSKFVLKFIDIFYRNFNKYSTQQQNEIINTITFIVRKAAHFLEYFILGLLSAGIAATYNSRKRYFKYTLSTIFSVIYAAGDEIHQYFVPGRACKITDVFIDAAGSICAIVLIVVLLNVIKKRKTGEIDAKKETS